jgi:Biotin-lipoyl like
VRLWSWVLSAVLLTVSLSGMESAVRAQTTGSTAQAAPSRPGDPKSEQKAEFKGEPGKAPASPAATDQSWIARQWAWLTGLVSFGAERGRAPGSGPGSAPPPAVTISRPIARPITEWDEYTGRFDAVELVEVRARVSGYLTDVLFTDGQIIKKGDPLFKLDQRPFERALETAKAELTAAKTKVESTSKDVVRGRPLADRKIISEKSIDDRENLKREAEAAVVVAEAKVRSAELDLSFTAIASPIGGRISRNLISTGNYVTGGGAGTQSLLTTIVTQDPIQFYFDVSESNTIKYKRLAASGAKGLGETTRAPSTSPTTAWMRRPTRSGCGPCSTTRLACSRLACSVECGLRAQRLIRGSNCPMMRLQPTKQTSSSSWSPKTGPSPARS